MDGHYSYLVASKTRGVRRPKIGLHQGEARHRLGNSVPEEDDGLEDDGQ
jgi:hypothetical protein